MDKKMKAEFKTAIFKGNVARVGKMLAEFKKESEAKAEEAYRLGLANAAAANRFEVAEAILTECKSSDSKLYSGLSRAANGGYASLVKYLRDSCGINPSEVGKAKRGSESSKKVARRQFG